MDVTPNRPDSADASLDPRRDRRLDGGLDADAGGAMVLRAEELRVRMVPEVTGRVTLRKRLVTEERTVVVTVQREELDVAEEGASGPQEGAAAPAAGAESDYVNAAATGGLTPDAVPTSAFSDPAAGAAGGAPTDGLDETDAGELILFEQRPVVTLEWVPVERVRVERATVVEQQTFTGEVRREEAEVLEEGPGSR